MTADARLIAMDAERLAKLEQKVDDTQRMVDRRLAIQEEDVKSIREDVHAIRLQLSGFKGFWQGVVLAVSTVAAAVGALAMATWDKITGGEP